MTRLDFDATSVYQARCPRATDVSGILKLGQTFIAHEHSLGLGNGTPFTALIATRVGVLEASLTSKATGTGQIVSASGSLKQLDEQNRARPRRRRRPFTVTFQTGARVQASPR